MRNVVTALQWVLVSYLGFWLIYMATAMVSYVFTGTTFNPLGLDQDRSAVSGITCLFTILGLGVVAAVKGEWK